MQRFTTVALLCSLACVTGTCVDAAQPRKGAPNFIIFLTDDQGWGDLGCYGHPEIKSPNLDRFAEQGVRFTQAYSACGVCSPSRAAILTGRTPYRNGVWRWVPSGSDIHLKKSEITLATLLKGKDYDTCHAGKWHLNGKFNDPAQPQPNDHGYDHWLATQNNASPHHMNPKNFVRNGKPTGVIKGPSAVIAANEAIRWLRDRRDKTKPFFITVWTHEPHLPIESAPRYMEHYRHIKDEGIRQHHGNITQLDDAFGHLVKAIDDMGYTDNTAVFFTSDNGPEGNGTSGRTRGSTGGLRGRKRADYEGGIRVPGIVRYPTYFKTHNIKPGSVSNVPIIGSDLFTTVCELADVPVPEDRIIDGASILPALANQPIKRSQPLYWRTHISPADCRVAVRVDDWKIVADAAMENFQLFDMKQDWQETTNLAEKHPDRFETMKQLLIEHDAAVRTDGGTTDVPEGKGARKKGPRKPRKKGSLKHGKSRPLSQGTDNTGTFSIVTGGTVNKGGLAFQFESSGEAIALFELKQEPIRKRGTFQFAFRTDVTTNTKNAMFVFGSQPTNEHLVKVGAAIGMGSLNIFRGDWSGVGSGVKVKGKYKPEEKISAEITVDLEKRTIVARFNDQTIQADLPADIEEIRYCGYYVKNTRSTFTALDLGASK